MGRTRIRTHSRLLVGEGEESCLGVVSVQVYLVVQQGAYFEWYSQPDLSGALLGTEARGDLSFDFATGVVYAGLSDNISAKITSMVKAPATSTFTFSTFFDDGLRYYFDSLAKFDKFTQTVTAPELFTVSLVLNNFYSIHMYFSEGGGNAFVTNSWSYTGVATSAIPASMFYVTALIGSSPYTVTSVVAI